MCKCLYEAAKRMEENGYEDVEPPIELLSGRAYLNFAGKKKGKKKQQEIPLLLSRCPICGEKYDKERH